MAHVCILSTVHDALDNRVFYREARSLQRAGHRVTLAAVHPRDEVKDGVHIIPLPRVRRWLRPLLWWRLLRIAISLRADAYHFHDPELLLVAPWLRLLTRKPTVYDVHEVYPDFIRVKDYLPAWVRHPIAWAFTWIEPLLARMNSALVFADDQIAAGLSAAHRPGVTLFNFPERGFVDEAATATAGVEREEPIVLYLGGMERNRGSHLMIEAFHQVQQAMPQARLLVVGHFMPPDLQQEIEAHASRLGIGDAVALTGRVPFEKIGDYLLRAAVGWVTWQPVPKNEKNIPTKLFEYMAYALPVVAGDLASTRPFIRDGDTGYLVRADDPAAHARAILRLLQH
ncbi:MAG: glycosyltransferase, partial [Anaerolineae bacterium]|nr:glycosyltransferase [Anaerolineae bacterium]